MNQSKQQLKAFWTLLQREFWEHKVLWLWVPLILCGLDVLAVLFKSIFENVVFINLFLGPGMRIGNQKANFLSQLLQMMHTISILMVVYGTVAQFIYLYSAISKERESNNINFWRSLPPNDSYIIASKIRSALLVIPALMFAISFTVMLLITILGESAWLVFNLFNPRQDGWHFLWTYIIQLNIGSSLTFFVRNYFPITILCALWSLPLVCFLLLVQTYSKRVGSLIAVAIIVFCVNMEPRIFHTNYVENFTKVHLIGGTPLVYYLPTAYTESANDNGGDEDEQSSRDEANPTATSDSSATFIIKISPDESNGIPPLKSWSFAIGLLLSALFFTLTIYIRKRQAKF
jgi:hypothetical protein